MGEDGTLTLATSLHMDDEELGNRPMKFWEVGSAFRGFEDIHAETYARAEWRYPFYDWFVNSNEIVRVQDRAILDAFVPLERSAAIAKQIPLKFEFNGTLLRIPHPSIRSNQSWQLLTMIQVHDTFGGAYIEEVLERGIARVADASYRSRVPKPNAIRHGGPQ